MTTQTVKGLFGTHLEVRQHGYAAELALEHKVGNVTNDARIAHGFQLIVGKHLAYPAKGVV